MAHWTKALALEPLAAEVDELGLEGADDLYLIDREMEARLRNKVCHALAAQTTHLWGSTRAGVILLRFTGELCSWTHFSRAEILVLAATGCSHGAVGPTQH